MGAVRRTAVAALRRRRLQAVGIATVLFLSTATATLALRILVESHAPFDRAFAATNGAHLVIRYRGDLDPARLAATGMAGGVTASEGPWPVAQGALGSATRRIVAAGFSARPDPDATIDAAEIETGRWWAAPGEVVLSDASSRALGLRVGDTVSVYAPTPGAKGAGDPFGSSMTPGRSLTVVGIAASVSTPEVAGWMSPADLTALFPSGTLDQEMLYRVTPSGTDADLTQATASIVAGLPADAISESQTYLEIKAGVDQLADLYVPVLLAFAIFALLAAAFLIANVVTGVLLTSYRDVGVMKAVGFTPRQVSAILGAQMLIPAAVGAALGIVVGSIASQPVVHDTAASFGVPVTEVISIPVVIGVAVVSLLATGLAAWLPAVRAGRISAVEAMTRGSAPSSEPGGGRLRRLGLRAPIGLSGRLGVSAGLAHPGRAMMTLGALVVGVAAATFALGLDWSLLRVMDDLNRPVASPIRVESSGGEFLLGPDGGATPIGQDHVPVADPAAVTAAIKADPSTAHAVAIGQTEVNVPGLAALPFVGYDGDTSWLGYALIEGAWFSAPGEAVAPTDFFRQSGLHVGDTTTVTRAGHAISIRLVGEVFDIPDEGHEGHEGLVLRGTWSDLAALDPTVQPDRWEAQPDPGTDLAAYRTSLQDAIGAGAAVFIEGDSAQDASFLLFLSVVGVLGVVLVAMSLGGVFNTVLLETRQRAREVAVLKAVGLTPAQVVTMVIATVVPVGLLAGLIGVPIGLAAQRAVLSYMGEVAANTAIPADVYGVFPRIVLVGLGLLGLGIGAVGAYLPAQRAARASIAPVLQAE